jgi:GTP-binding protein
MALKLAIVGRPNVGKSTLFNRLAGKKLAIVDDQPGVTRDRRFADGRLGDLDLILIDTAGFEDVTDESLEARMRQQTELAVQEADVALFVIDAREGVTPADRVFGELLRKSGKAVVLAANKAEGKAGEAGALDAYSLGFGEPLQISGEHGEGMAELYAALLELEEQFDREAEEKGDKPIMLAIVGRPNAGKSTLVNRLIGEDRLLTGPEAGITRDAISVDWEYGGRQIRLVDTAGLRRKAKVNEKLEKLSTGDTIRAITFAEVVCLVMDATHPFETQDLQIADLIEREGRALVFILAKWDLVEDPQATLKDFIEHAERMLPQVRGAPVVALSGATGRGVERLMPAILKTHRDWSSKIKTRELNDWLQLAMQRHPPPAVAGRRIKPKYMAQTKAKPPTFVLFSSRADQMPEHYRRYLVNSLRESFDLPGVPLRITIKSGKNPYAEGGEKSGAAPPKPGEAYKPKRASGLARSIAKQKAAAEGTAAKPARKPAKKSVPKGISKGVGLKKAAAAKAARTGRPAPRASSRKSPRR